VLENVPNMDNLERLTEFVLCMPGTNVKYERIFSEIKYMWSQWKSNLKVETVNALVKTRNNLTNQPEEMFQLLVSESKFRKTISDNQKYQLAKFINCGDHLEGDDGVAVLIESESGDITELESENEEDVAPRHAQSQLDESPHPQFDDLAQSQPIHSSEQSDCQSAQQSTHPFAKRPISTPSPKVIQKVSKGCESGSRVRKSLSFDSSFEETLTAIEESTVESSIDTSSLELSLASLNVSSNPSHRKVRRSRSKKATEREKIQTDDHNAQQAAALASVGLEKFIVKK